MSIQLPNDLESAAEKVALSLGFQTTAAYVTDVLRRELETVESDLTPAHSQNTPEWRAEFRAWASSRPKVTHPVDTDRDSIYGLRGL